ncbi:hypothetical protein Wcon_00993 [Wolbachia endosymbiont of Cylisticus convexus]|nr:hypothetical protein Wcon_01846 [Wolbachia endosymbiont of Cylisticus convexus]RDD34263.1 hypothetical protein Wcon_01678 [Wolbachia endosymbiont of Cylisticus convexus]RDD34514.1 hypothetical protein Wcon_01383 [Wolbachia endosymbiont of Cylisticus convexus]RDD34909.1 hypothetical protein Wcon_00993 [Wolbachia endosymbiont of Cylisticus convexus]
MRKKYPTDLSKRPNRKIFQSMIQERRKTAKV